jgi:integrase
MQAFRQTLEADIPLETDPREPCEAGRPESTTAAIPSRRIYDFRRTFATHALAAGLSIFEVARFMGTSVRVIDSTYGHLAHGSEQLARQRLDVWALNGRGGETGTS